MKNIYLGLLGISMYVASACASTPKAPQGNCDAVEDGQYTNLAAVEVVDEVAVEELIDAEEDSDIVAYESQRSSRSPQRADEEGMVEPQGKRGTQTKQQKQQLQKKQESTTKGSKQQKQEKTTKKQKQGKQ